MSIDYDQLRERLEESTPGPWERNPESPRVLCNLERKFAVHVELTRNGEEPQPEDVTNTELIALAPDMARELLRLRDGVERYRDAGKALVRANLRSWNNSGCSSCTPLANLVDITNRLTDLLEGGEE